MSASVHISTVRYSSASGLLALVLLGLLGTPSFAQDTATECVPANPTQQNNPPSSPPASTAAQARC